MTQLYSVSSITCMFAGMPVLTSNETLLYDTLARAIQRIANTIIQSIVNAVSSLRAVKIAIPATTESEIFTSGMLMNYANPNTESYTNHFKDANITQHAIAYVIPGIPKSDEYNRAIFNHFVQPLISSADNEDPRALFLASMNDEDKKTSALHASAILALIGNENQPVSTGINSNLITKGYYLDPTSTQRGLLTILNSNIGVGEFKFQVTDETVVLKYIEGKPIATYTTTRTITVFPPDQDGNVRYTIERSFQPTL